MGTNFDVYTDHPASSHGLTQTAIKNERATVRDAGFDNHVRLDLIDYFLQAQHILRKLYDWSSHPGERIDVLVVPSSPQPNLRDQGEGFGSPYVIRLFLRTVFDANEISLKVNCNH